MGFDPDQVSISCATLLVDPMRCDRAAFERIVPAVAGAGFRAVSLWPWHAQAVGTALVQSMLADAGISVVVVEALTRWANSVSQELQDEARPTLDFASMFGADLVLACVLEERIDSPERAAEGFAQLCELAAAYDTRVCLEFLPWTGIPDLRTAWELVQAAGSPNGGLLLDTWHWQRQPGGPDLDLLRRIPGERIYHVQLSDAGPERPVDLLTETISARMLPGAGVVDMASVVTTLVDIGADPVVGAEVFNTGLAALGPAEMARAVRDTCTAVLRTSHAS